MFATVDLYCERLGPQFWAEPFNALTNISFFIAAWFSFLRAKHHDAITPAVWVLLGLMCAIGVGSTAFHTVANNLTKYLDLVPILIFQLTYVWLYFRKIIGIRPVLSLLTIISYLVVAIFCRQIPHLLNGSLVYAPAIVVMFGIGIYHAITHRNEHLVIIGAATVFLISLFSRTVDQAVCSGFSAGTHFVWHLLNGLVLYLLMRAFLANHTEVQKPTKERNSIPR